jgi:adenylate kinase family enzyme
MAMQRVMIVGGPGSGKSTLACALGLRTGLPVYHMDHIHWQPGWVERSKDDKDRLTEVIHARARWIFEGGHSRTYGSRVARADTLIWLDLPVGLRFRRVLWRSVRWWGRSRPDLPAGCIEQFGPETLPFWRFIWRTRASARQPLLAILAAPPVHLQIVHLRHPRAVAAYLAGL